jgi:hypothetical protein
MRRTFVAVCALFLASGCDSGGNPLPPIEAQPAPAYRPVVDLRQTMEWILDPAADVIWDSAGFVITAQGETDLAPTTDEGWEHVRNSAAVVAETGNLLMMPGRSAGPAWEAFARGLIAAGEVAIAAAEAHDSTALFDAGGQIYQVCRGCHEQYLVPLEEARSAQ